MRYQVVHSTVYRYNDPVSISQNVAHLRPRPNDRQTWLKSVLKIDPAPAVISERTDFFGNPLTFFALQESHRTLSVVSSGDVEVRPPPAVVSSRTPPWEIAKSTIRADRSADGLATLQFVYESQFIKMTQPLSEYAAPSFPAGRTIMDAMVDLCHRIAKDFKFDSRATSITTPLLELLSLRRGVCQDFAHLMIGCCRSVGLAARYVSGYLLTQPKPGRPRIVGGDASHAWASVYCPGSGWIEIDPTNDALVSDRHISIACGRDFGDVSPLQGVILGGRRHTLAISVDVSPVPAGPVPTTTQS